MKCPQLILLFFFLMIRRPPRSTLFPYTNALPISHHIGKARVFSTLRLGDTKGERCRHRSEDRKSTRLNFSHSQISYAVFCLKKKKKKSNINISSSSYYQSLHMHFHLCSDLSCDHA